MDPPPAGFVPPEGVAPIGFELQNMEEGGVGPAQSMPPPPPPPDQSALYQNANAKVNPNSIGDQGGGDKTVSPGHSNKNGADEICEEHTEDDIRLLESRSNTEHGSENQEEKTLFFRDGQRRIDYMFAYKHPENHDEKKERRREVFETNLRKAGLNLEHETIQYDKDTVEYIKVHAPWDFLCAQAEVMNMKMPLAENDMVESMTSCWQKCPTPFDYDEDILPSIPDYFTAAFSREREQHTELSYWDPRVGRARWFIIENKDTFFSPAQRSLLVYQLLQRCVFEENEEDKSKNKFGIKKMLTTGSYDAAYPLHEGEFSSEHSLLTRGKQNNRHLLYETWAKPGAWYKFQPLDHIRLYFGEKIGIYFTWLGYYTWNLIPAAIVGLAAFIYGLCTFSDDTSSLEICDETGVGAQVMCPLCDGRCPYWQLWKSCTYSIISYLFDNEATVFFAAFMALWAEFFIEFWKRRTAEIQYDWDVADFEEEETVRPEFEASVKKRRKNPINKNEEPYMGLLDRLLRYMSSLSVILFMLLIVVAAVFGVILYRMTVSALLFGVNQAEVSQWSSTITSITAACINLLCIIILGRVYLVLARALTDFESHRTQTEWEDSFTLKMFLFQFVNHYSSLFYIAFFKGKFSGRPGEYNRGFNDSRQEECDPSGCIIELLIQLMIIMVGKQAFNNTKELLLPKIMNWFKSRRVKEEQKEDKHVAAWEKDYNMATMPDLGLFDEYLEMVLQFGFVTVFVAAFPLAPLFALLNNIIEIRLDAYKFVTQWRRPLASRAQDIGIWFGILRGISAISVATNAAIIAFTSEFIPKMVYRYTEAKEAGDLEGYINFTLSNFSVKDFEPRSIPKDPVIMNVTHCSYRDFRSAGPDYKVTIYFWHILTARLAFIICFILVVVFLKWLISFLVTDIPKGVKMQILREKYLAKESILAAEVVKRGGVTPVPGSSPARHPQDTGGASLPPDQPLY